MLNQKIKALSIWRTIYYLPAVISGVAVSLLWSWVFNPDFGLLNEGLRALGVSNPPGWLSDRRWALPAMILMQMWSAGGGMVVYLAGLQSVPTQLYEAATIDGATRLQRIIHINLPAIMPTIVIMLIMAVGGIMNLSFEKVLLMQTDSNTAVSEVISTYVYKLGIQRAQYSLSAAVGLFNNIINLILLVTVNKVSRKISETSLW